MNGDHLGPVLTHVQPDDVAAVEALFAEQRARLDVVREHCLWDWLGGVPTSFAKPTAPLHGLWAQLAGLGFLALALFTAGFTRGPVLGALLGAACVSFAVREVVLCMPTRRAVRFLRRSVLVPAVVVGVAPDEDPEQVDVRCVAALVAPNGVSPDAVRSFVAAGDRLRCLVEGVESAPPPTAAFVATIRDGLAARLSDGSRLAVPAELGGDHFELARFFVVLPLLPRTGLHSRLLFVLLDRSHRGANSTRIVQYSVWGSGVEALCAAFPREGDA